MCVQVLISGSDKESSLRKIKKRVVAAPFNYFLKIPYKARADPMRKPKNLPVPVVASMRYSAGRLEIHIITNPIKVRVTLRNIFASPPSLNFFH